MDEQCDHLVGMWHEDQVNIGEEFSGGHLVQLNLYKYCPHCGVLLNTRATKRCRPDNHYFGIEKFIIEIDQEKPNEKV